MPPIGPKVANRDFARNVPKWDKGLMDRQTRELALLCIIACVCTALALLLGYAWFVAIFAAEAVWALFMAVYPLMPPD
jgi:hypothetical protein